MIKKFLIAFVVVAFAATTQAVQLRQVEAGNTNTAAIAAAAPVIEQATAAAAVVAEGSNDVEKSKRSDDDDEAEDAVEWEGSGVIKNDDE